VSERKPTSVVLPAVVVLMVLGIYVGAYYAAVRPYVPRPGIRTSVVFPVYDFPIGPKRPDQWLGMAFAPFHWLDRRIRPHVWEPKP
jgi:hypothetical protein